MNLGGSLTQIHEDFEEKASKQAHELPDCPTYYNGQWPKYMKIWKKIS